MKPIQFVAVLGLAFGGCNARWIDHAGRFQLVERSGAWYLLDTASGDTWVRCEVAKSDDTDTLFKWCPMAGVEPALSDDQRPRSTHVGTPVGTPASPVAASQSGHSMGGVGGDAPPLADVSDAERRGRRSAGDAGIGSGSQPEEAKVWLRANPDHPKAAAVRRKLEALGESPDSGEEQRPGPWRNLERKGEGGISCLDILKEMQRRPALRAKLEAEGYLSPCPNSTKPSPTPK